MTYRSVTIKRGVFGPYGQLWSLIKCIDGDVIYAIKPLFSSFGIGLIAKLLKKKPLILDIDDWERGFLLDTMASRSWLRNLLSIVKSVFFSYLPGSFWNVLICEAGIVSANAMTVSNGFLQRKFGGTLIPHVRDTDLLNPDKHLRAGTRAKYSIDADKKVVMFFGTLRPHKGGETLIQAVESLHNDQMCLMIVGIDAKDAYAQTVAEKAREKLGDRFMGLGFQPFDKVSELLALADIVVISQRKNESSRGQIPAKLFDAMAMAKPIIATSINDITEILGDDCGVLIENDEDLSEAIQSMIADPLKADRLGRNAREKCILKYSWTAIAPRLRDLITKTAHAR